MKKLLIIFLSLFLYTSQANAFLGFGVAKYAYSKLPKKEQEQVKGTEQVVAVRPQHGAAQAAGKAVNQLAWVLKEILLVVGQKVNVLLAQVDGQNIALLAEEVTGENQGRQGEGQAGIKLLKAEFLKKTFYFGHVH